MSEFKRRKLLKSIATLSGVGAAGQLSSTWVKPVVDSVVLPAHATTTDASGSSPGANACPATTVNSVPGSLTVQALANAPESDEDGIEIIFDGCSKLTLVKGDESTGTADDIVYMDADSKDSDVFDAETGPGANWQMLSNSFGSDPYVSDVPEGPHSIQVKRLTGPTTGRVYTISFNVEVSNVYGDFPGADAAAAPEIIGVEMTVSAVQASPN